MTEKITSEAINFEHGCKVVEMEAGCYGVVYVFKGFPNERLAFELAQALQEPVSKTLSAFLDKHTLSHQHLFTVIDGQTVQ